MKNIYLCCSIPVIYIYIYMILYICCIYTIFDTYNRYGYIHSPVEVTFIIDKIPARISLCLFFQIAPTEQGRATAKTCNQLVFVVFETVASKGIPQGKETCQSSVLLPTSQCAPWTKKNINHEYRFCFENAFAMRWRLGTTAEFMLLSCSY